MISLSVNGGSFVGARGFGLGTRVGITGTGVGVSVGVAVGLRTCVGVIFTFAGGLFGWIMLAIKMSEAAIAFLKISIITLLVHPSTSSGFCPILIV